jgi:hypothetical protein
MRYSRSTRVALRVVRFAPIFCAAGSRRVVFANPEEVGTDAVGEHALLDDVPDRLRV